MARIDTSFIFAKVMEKLIWGQYYIINQLVTGSMSASQFTIDIDRTVPTYRAPACPYPTSVFGYEAV